MTHKDPDKRKSSKKESKNNKGKSKTSKKNGTVKEFHHVLVPVHELLSKEEAEKVIKKYGDKNLFPKIKKNDPALALFGIKAKPGDIIKITRNDPTGRYAVYRVVRK